MDGDPINEDSLRQQFVGQHGSHWRRIDVVAEAGSTNVDLAARARAGEAPGAVLITDHQSAGRGRRGRVWTAPPGTNIAMSVLVQPYATAARWTWLPLLTGMAVADGLVEAAAVPARLKWPNDVLIGDGKVAGILAERVDTPGGAMAVLGMGVNVHLEQADLPVPTATSLALQGLPVVPARTALIAAVLTALDRYLDAWERGIDLQAAYAERCVTLGLQVRVLLAGDAVVTGRAVGVDSDGRLVVQTADGPQAVGAGDVVHVR